MRLEVTCNMLVCYFGSFLECFYSTEYAMSYLSLISVFKTSHTVFPDEVVK